MPKFNVHLYVMVRVKVPGIEANSPLDALCKAEEAADGEVLHNHFDCVGKSELLEKDADGKTITEVAYAEDVPEALVDIVGDEDYRNSTTFTVQNGAWVEDKDTKGRTGF